MRVTAAAVHAGRAVRCCQLLFNLRTLRCSDSGSIRYLVGGSRVPHPVGRMTARRSELGSRAEVTKNVGKMGTCWEGAPLVPSDGPSVVWCFAAFVVEGNA